MKYKITEDCVSCGECLFNCPKSCIKNEYGLFIDTEKCDNCKLCIELCPVDAIVVEK